MNPRLTECTRCAQRTWTTRVIRGERLCAQCLANDVAIILEDDRRTKAQIRRSAYRRRGSAFALPPGSCGDGILLRVAIGDRQRRSLAPDSL